MKNRMILLVLRALSSPQIKRDAKARVRYAVAFYGENALRKLEAKRSDPRRRKSRRSLDLALAEIRAGEAMVAERPGAA
jgi:hypothetical protein